ncbi:MAG: lysostaphin resistance A-like protein, partial [Planctomycetota bacterium]
KGPWGFWATVGFSAAIVAAYLVVCVVIAVIFIVAVKVTDPQASIEQIGETLEQSGLLMAIAGVLTTPPVFGLCVLFAWCRKGPRVADYLGFRLVPVRQVLIWLGILAVYLICSDTLTVLIGRPVVPETMVTTYQTSVFPPLLFFAIIICAPLAEEIFYRGFMFEGLQATRLGPVGATIITSLLWAVVHMQYDWYGITSIFFGGLILGAARVKTRSVLLPMLMHAVQNLIASGELLISQAF